MIRKLFAVALGGLVASPSFAELINVNWVLVNSTFGINPYPSLVTQSPFWTSAASQGLPVFTWDLQVETTPDDRFLSADIDVAADSFFNPYSQIGPNSHWINQYDSYISGPDGATGISVESGEVGTDRFKIAWSYNPATPVLGGRRTLARITCQNFPNALFSTPYAIRLASAPDTLIAVPRFQALDSSPNQWLRRASGDWNDPFNWGGGRLPYAMAEFRFGITAPLTITANTADPTVEQLYFTTPHSIGISGSRNFVMRMSGNNNCAIQVREGHHSINMNVQLSAAQGETSFYITPGCSLSVSKLLPQATAYIRKDWGGLLRVGSFGVGSLVIANGEVELTGLTASKTDQLRIVSGGTLDLGNAGFVITSPNTATSIASILDGRITTQSANRVVGNAVAAEVGITQFLGEQVSPTSLLLRATLRGDADLNGIVNLDDFTRLAAQFGLASGWSSGDFDYSGVTDLDDFTLLAANYYTSARFQAIPEPRYLTAAGFIAVVAAAGTRRIHPQTA